MQEIQKIECKNKAWFVMSFKTANPERMTDATANFPISQSATIDLAASTYAEGDTVWPVVSAVLGKTQAAEHQLKFSMNQKTAVYKVTGTTLNYKIELVEIKDGSSSSPADFPADIPVNKVPFKNWSGSIDLPSIWTCAPRTATDVVAVCNWAMTRNWTVRPRGIMHNWSPLSLAKDNQDVSRVMLIDTTKALNSMHMVPAENGKPAMVNVQTGATMGDLMSFLEQQSNPSSSAASGYSFPHTPAPDHLTVGGVLAINGHGSGVRTLPNDDFPCSYGSMSNHILQIQAVVTDPNKPDKYQLKTFNRGDQDCKAMLTQLGKSLIVEVTLHVIDNYNLRCQSFTDIDASTLFAQPVGGKLVDQSMASFLQQAGRIEAIWFPFTDYPWLKVWEVAKERPIGARQVDEPNNYPFSDNLESGVTDIIKGIINGVPSLTPSFGKIMQKATQNGLDGKDILGIDSYPVSRDIWGASKNCLFYVKDTTLRVTANGYAVLMKKSNVQNALADFTNQFTKMLQSYHENQQYPINAPLEIRITGLDSPEHVPNVFAQAPERPVISALSTDKMTEKNGWDVALWLDVLTLPGTAYSNQFFRELEEWLLQRFNGDEALVVPEWSKGWAYTDKLGPWTNTQFIKHIKEAFTMNREGSDNWEYERKTLAKYDAHNLFVSPLLDQLFEQK